MISKISSIIACAFLASQINTQSNQNQHTVNQIVNAIKTSGISSGINEQHINKVLRSSSLNSGKATINVINIVPKKKVVGYQNSNSSFSQGLTLLSDTTNKQNTNFNKDSSSSNLFETKNQFLNNTQSIPPSTSTLSSSDQKIISDTPNIKPKVQFQKRYTKVTCQ